MASVETRIALTRLAQCLHAAMELISDRDAIHISGHVDEFVEFEMRHVKMEETDSEVTITIRGIT